MRETRETLRAWTRAPFRTLAPWLTRALLIAVFLLSLTLLCSFLRGGEHGGSLVGISYPASLADTLYFWQRNLLVLTLHSLVCLATYLARRSLPLQAELRSGINRWVHTHTPRAAMLFVAGATIFSLATQAWVNGALLAGLAHSLDRSPPLLLLPLLPHALLELTAVFLPLAAALQLGRYHAERLLAATLICSLISLPLLLLSALGETYLGPLLTRLILGV